MTSLYMKKRAPLQPVALVISLLTPGPVAAQSTCRASDDESTRLINAARWMMTSSDARWIAARQAYQLSAGKGAVVLVTNDSICARAAAALNSVLPDSLRRARAVYVVQAGDRYIVEDRSDDTKGGEFQFVITSSSSFAVLARIAS